MRFAVEYESTSGTIGLCIFSADNEQAAQMYVEAMIKEYRHTNVFNLNQLTNGADIEELYRLFPRLTTITDREGIPRKK